MSVRHSTSPQNIYSPSAEVYLAGRTSANHQTSDQVTDFQLRIWPLSHLVVCVVTREPSLPGCRVRRMEEKGEGERERERERELSQLTGAFTHSRIFLSLLLFWSYLYPNEPSTVLNTGQKVLECLESYGFHDVWLNW